MFITPLPFAIKNLLSHKILASENEAKGKRKLSLVSRRGLACDVTKEVTSQRVRYVTRAAERIPKFVNKTTWPRAAR